MDTVTAFPRWRSSSRLRGSRSGSTVRQVAVFAAIGVVSTIAYAILYLAMRTAVEPAVANAIALVVTTGGNTAANRRLTFSVRGREGMVRDQVGGLAALGLALLITTAAATALATLAPDAGRLVELAVLIGANALATISRFLLLRRWIAGVRRPAPADPSGAPA
jgi:putative flippase GtrA